MQDLLFNAQNQNLYHAGRVWNKRAHIWEAAEGQAAEGEKVSANQAICWLQGSSPFTGLPIGIIGPKKANDREIELAFALGARIAKMKIPLLTGGKTGVMEAACKGAKSQFGLTIGILPDEEWGAANPYVDIPLASGIGPARNAIIARACPVLIAIGGEYGTQTEMAFGLHFNRKVIALADAPLVKGVSYVNTVDEAIERACLAYLDLA